MDNKYTTFGQVTDGFKAVQAIGAVPGDAQNKPNSPQTIDAAEVVPVTPGHNPYAAVGLGK